MMQKAKAEEYLKRALGDPEASFREGQWESIEHLLEGRRVLVVQRTGWGKSMVYFLAIRLLRDRGAGPCLLVSPLLALMRNQIDAAERIGLRAATINSDNTDDWPEIERRFKAGLIDLLLISPERLSNDEFNKRVLQQSAQNIGLLVIDEAHCISDWGHDFRPDYRRIAALTRVLPQRVPILATTATANDRVVNDIREQLGNDILILRGPLVRSSLRLQNIIMPDSGTRLAWMAKTIPGLKGSGIVYVLTVRDAEIVSAWLRKNGIAAKAYHAGVPKEMRPVLEDELLNNSVKVLVATVALGMGFDKPDVGFVIHYQRPQSAVHYYQQVGRAGRAIPNAYGVLLYGAEDDEIADYFIESAFPPQKNIAAVLRALEDADEGMTMTALEGMLNLRRKKLNAVMKFLLLEDPAPVAKIDSRYYLTPSAYSYETDRSRLEGITALRRREQDEMQRYMKHEGCLMQFLQDALDDPHAAPCGKCMNCAPQEALDPSVSSELIRQAGFFLRKYHHPIQPRKQWPSSGFFSLYDFPGGVKIPSALMAEEGRALCMWNDAGWGKMVRDGKYLSGSFPGQLVDACLEMVKEWDPRPAPQWVTCIPSISHPGLVPDFAARLAEALGIPFVPCLKKIRRNNQQKTMENSAMQAKNLDGVFAVDRCLQGACLLVDDMVDSRWTFTVAAALLRQAGCSAVLPLALAITAGNDDV